MNVTAHFAVEDFACKSGDAYPVDAVCGEDGRSWLEARLRPLCEMLEVIREAAGKPIIVDSGYRTVAYDQRLFDHTGGRGMASPETSQHPRGRAADIVCRSFTSAQLHQLILDLYGAGKLPQLGGLGLYNSFIHVDVRPRIPVDHLARWGGSRLSNHA